MNRWFGIALVAITVLAYLHTLQCDYIRDDGAYVTGNHTLRTADGLRRIWFDIGAIPQYYPMVHTSYWIEYRLWRLEAAGYHAVNVLLHGLGALLLRRVLLRLALPGAWLAAAVFALHPVHVESVAWITERKNVAKAFVMKRERKHGKGKAMSIVAARLARAVYTMLKRGQSFDEERFFARVHPPKSPTSSN